MHWWNRKLKGHGEETALIEPNGAHYTYLDIVTRGLFLTSFGSSSKVVYLSPDLNDWGLSNLVCYVEQGKIIAMRKQPYYDLASHSLFHGVRRGLILETSGSTGKPKRILHDLDVLLEAHRKSNKQLRTIAFLKFDHIGGFNTVLYTLSAGGTLIVPWSLGIDDVCKAIANYKAELLPTTPSFLNMLILSNKHKEYDLSSLKVISFGTEPMSDYLLESVRDNFPNVQLKQTYGMSEVGILQNYTNPNDPNYFKLKDTMKIEDGRLYIKSPMAMVGYLDNENIIDEEGWLDTGDIVEEKNGYIRVLGREGDMINVGGLKVFPAEVENIILRVDNVEDVIVFGKSNPLLGSIVACKVKLIQQEDEQEAKQRILTYCKGRLEKHAVPMEVEISKESFLNKNLKKVRK